MKTRVRVAPQVESFVRSCAPEPRIRLSQSIKALASDQGSVRAFEGPLAGFRRLRVGGYRVVFAERFESGERVLDCVFVERRSIVYDLFEKLLAEEATRG